MTGLSVKAVRLGTRKVPSTDYIYVPLFSNLDKKKSLPCPIVYDLDRPDTRPPPTNDALDTDCGQIPPVSNTWCQSGSRGFMNLRAQQVTAAQAVFCKQETGRLAQAGFLQLDASYATAVTSVLYDMMTAPEFLALVPVNLCLCLSCCTVLAQVQQYSSVCTVLYLYCSC